MSIFLQSNELAQDAWWITGAVVLLIAGYLITRTYQKQQANHRESLEDPRANTVNDSNYNINREGIDQHRTNVKTNQEAQAAIDNLQKTEIIPTAEEFHEIKSKVDE